MKKFWQKNRKTIAYIIRAFLIWESVIFILELILPYSGIPVQNKFKYIETIIRSPVFLWNRANFDGIHYLDIIRKGYGLYQQAFFPFYPVVTRLVSPLFSNRNLVTGFLISNLSFLSALFVFYKLILLDYTDKVAQRTLLFLLLFPTSFYFTLVYTESLFLLLVLLCFYFARTRKWFWSGIFGALAANTRFVGIFLFPAILYELFSVNIIHNLPPSVGTTPKAVAKFIIRRLIPILIIPLGLIIYMYYLNVNYNDPLMFIHTQPFFGTGKSGGRIILPYQVLWRYLKMIFVTEINSTFYIVWLEFLTTMLFAFLLIKSYLLKIRSSYLIFAVIAFMVPILGGTLSSMPRYCLILFPCFICLGTIKNKTIQKIIIITFFCLAIINIALFFRGYWVS